MEVNPDKEGSTTLKTVSKLWEDFYSRLGDVDPQHPEKNNVVRVAMTPSRYKDEAKLIAPLISDGDKVLEFGGGYGGLCQELLKLTKPEAYMIIDNKPMLDQAAKYITGTPFTLIDAETIKDQEFSDFDLVISNFCLQETPREYQEWVFKNILPKTKTFFMLGNSDLDKDIEPLFTINKEPYLSYTKLYKYVCTRK